jgi:hypothetical protein
MDLSKLGRGKFEQGPSAAAVPTAASAPPYPVDAVADVCTPKAFLAAGAAVGVPAAMLLVS